MVSLLHGFLLHFAQDEGMENLREMQGQTERRRTLGGENATINLRQQAVQERDTLHRGLHPKR